MVVRWWLLVLAMFAVSGCGGGGGSVQVQVPLVAIDLSVSPVSVSVDVGSSQVLSAVVTYIDGSQRDVTASAQWASSNTGVATVSLGRVDGVSSGGAYIDASYDGLFAYSFVAVSQPIVVSGLSISPNPASVTVGGTSGVQALLQYSDGNSDDVTAQAQWTSTTPSLFSVTSGQLGGIALGSGTVSASYQGITAQASVSVVAAPTATGLTVSPAAASVGVGATQQLTATVSYSDGSQSDVSADAQWLSSDSGVAAVNAGAVTGIGEGAVTISASFGGKNGQSAITVTAAPSTYTVSGVMTATSSSVVDSDVNDTAAPYAANDTMSQAQLITTPALVGGYANVRWSGERGTSYRYGDPIDYYRVDLSANQTITMNVADATAGDLDLVLYDGTGKLVDGSVGTGSVESVTVPAAGTYYIQVYAYSGASNYSLYVGLAAGTADASMLHLMDDFVPGEVVARFDDTATASAVQQGNSPAELGLSLERGAAGRPMLFRLNTGSAVGAVVTDNAPDSLPPQLLEKWRTITAIKSLRKRDDVRYAEPNYRVRAAAIPNDSLYPYQWDLPLISLPQAWEITSGDSSVVVAVVDTGILPNHPDLLGQWVAGYDFVSDSAAALDGDGIDPDPTDPGDGAVGGSSFHGSHVAGTIAAATNNAKGVAGVAWGARIMPIRVLGKNGSGTSYDVNQGIRYAAGLSNDSGTVPGQRADIINLSLGGGGYSASDQDTITAARAAGVMVVAAAGNDSSSSPSYPAAYTGVISVSAVDSQRNLAYYSNFGSSVDVAAPGGDTSQDRNFDGYPDGIMSTVANDSGSILAYTYANYQGTSMAAPHVAGVLALMKAVNPALTPAAVDALLVAGKLTDDIGTAGRDDQYGYGLINAYKAVLAANGGEVPAVPVSTPSSLNFGATTETLSIAVGNGGGGSLRVLSVDTDASWLSAMPISVDGGGLGTYQIRVDRSGLGTGSYSATVSVAADAGTVTVPVLMSVYDGTLTVDAGHQYVLLLDPDTGYTQYEVSVDAVGGLYTYSFSGVAPGSYRLLAGTDMNNDYQICDAGEACGSYLTLDIPKILVVDKDRTGIDFTTSFEGSVNSTNAATVGDGATGRGGVHR